MGLSRYVAPLQVTLGVSDCGQQNHLRGLGESLEKTKKQGQWTGKKVTSRCLVVVVVFFGGGSVQWDLKLSIRAEMVLTDGIVNVILVPVAVCGWFSLRPRCTGNGEDSKEERDAKQQVTKQ